MNTKKTFTKVIGLIIPFVLFGLWAWLIFNGKLVAFDNGVQSAIFSIRNDFLTPIGVALEYVGHWPLPALVCVIMLACKKTRLAYGVPMSACVATSVGMYVLLKSIFQRPRPSELLWLCMEHGYSFPSGHTLNNTVFWVVFASLIAYYFIHKGKSLPIYKKLDGSTSVYPKTKAMRVLIEVILIAWPLIIGLSRIYVGVHWPSDVVGSLILSIGLIQVAKAILFKGDK